MAAPQALSTVLSLIQNYDTDKERIGFLQNFPERYAVPLRAVLKYMFDDSKFLLPPGAPSFTTSNDADPSVLFREVRKFYHYVEGGNPNLKQGKRELMFQQLIEDLVPGDANLIIHMKDKTSPYQGLTKAVVKKAFPDLLS